MGHSNSTPSRSYIVVGDAYWDFCFAPVEHLPSPGDEIVFVPSCASRNPAGSLGYLAIALSVGLGLPSFKIIANVGDEKDFFSNEWLRRLNAAGDFFYAAFVATLMKGGDMSAAATFANRVAGASIQHLTLENKLKAVQTLV